MGKFFEFRPTTVGQLQRVTRIRRDLAANVAVNAGRPAVMAGGYWREPAAGAATHSQLQGRFSESVDNTGGAAGAKAAEVDLYHEIQVIWLNNDTAGTPVVKADRGTLCYWAGPTTVTADDDTGANAAAGMVWDVTTDGAFVGVKVEG